MRAYLQSVAFATCLTLALSPLVYLSAKPDRPIPKKPLPVPNIAGDSRWGTITQSGKKIEIDGDPKWYVKHGEIRADGKLFVIWIFRDDGKAAPGLYTINADRSITGHWQWGESAMQDDKGNWIGLTQTDTLRFAAVPDL